VGVPVEAGHGVGDEHGRVAVVVGGAGGGLHTEVRRDAAEHDRLDVVLAQDLVDAAGREGAPAVLHHDHVVLGWGDGQLTALRLRAAGPFDADPHHEPATLPDRVGQPDAPLEDLFTAVRHGRQRDDPRHQIDQDHRRTPRIEVQ
jgi:hypothetical protein